LRPVGIPIRLDRVEDFLESIKRRPGTQGPGSDPREGKIVNTSPFLQPGHNPTNTIERQATRRDSSNQRGKVLPQNRILEKQNHPKKISLICYEFCFSRILASNVRAAFCNA
jgi:hypothetical protein